MMDWGDWREEEFGREGGGKEGREEFAKWIRRISRAALTMSRRN